MDQEQIRLTYEQIDNQILRLLLYFGGAVIVALSSGLTYLWHAWRAEQRERIDLDRVNAAALNSVANELDRLSDEVREIRQALTAKTASHEKRSQ